MELEIKVMCCKGLTAFNFFRKLTLYAAVSITSENEKLLLTQEQKQEQKTPVDDNGDGNPEWNYSMKFDLRSLNSINPNFKDLSLLFELRNQGQLQFLWDKTIGEVRVPLTDLIQSGMGEVVRFVSYEVRNPEGKHNGILDFSCKVIGNNNSIVSTNHDNITGYHHHHHQPHEHDANSDVHVIGYHHHHNQELQLNESNTQDGKTHMIGYHHHHYNHNLNESAATDSDSDSIQYPKIDLGEYNSTALLVYPPPPPPSSSSASTTSSSFSSTATTSAHYYPPAPAVYPPPSQQTWAEPPLSHYPPPPPPQQHHVYPPPQPQPYGDPHWGYYRPPGYHYW